jgi:4-amino-4-deoxy-L-arabinose transferase-like glycosyltransferase
VVTLLVVMLHLWQLGTPPMAGTEGHRALTAHQMVESGDWLVPHLWDNVYLRKPPMQYWLIGSLEWLTGQANLWIWRLPSVLCSALLAGMLVRMTTRHAGSLAGWCTGLAYASLLVLWQQSRSADIDSANTCFAVMAALGLLQLQDKTLTPTRQCSLMAMVFIGTASTLLLKGHGAMPVILGAWVGPWLMNRSQNRKPWDWQLWLPILLGVLPLVIWIVLVYQQFAHNTHMADKRGISEAATQLTGHLKDYLKAVALPVNLLLFSMPVSLGVLLLPKWLAARPTTAVSQSPLWLNLRHTALVAAVIYIAAATFNPRYAYPNLPLLCPIMGIMLGDWLTGQHHGAWQAGLTRGVGIFLWLLVIIHGALAAVVMRQTGIQIMLITSLVIAIISAYGSEMSLRKNSLARCLIMLAVVLGSLAIPFAAQRNLTQQRGGYVAANDLIALTNDEPQQILLARKVAYDQPELFYYTGRPTSALPHDIKTLIATYPQATLILHVSEYEVMADELAPYVTSVTPLMMHGQKSLRVVKIDARQVKPDTSLPSQ